MNTIPETALITGASRGLGAALAAQLAHRGIRVVLLARDPEPLHAVCAAIERAGGRAFALPADVGDWARAGEVAARAAALVGPIELLVNNASTLGQVPLPLLLDQDPGALARAFAVNVVGAFALTRAVAGSMLVRGGGTVVQISSDAAVQHYPRWGAYAASKAAADHLQETWRTEFSGSGVRFVSVDPGEMDTEMHSAAIPDADRAALASPAVVAARLIDGLCAPDLARLPGRWVIDSKEAV